MIANQLIALICARYREYTSCDTDTSVLLDCTYTSHIAKNVMYNEAIGL